MRRLISVLILFMIVVVPVFVKADTKSYSIDRLVESAVINEAGDIEIHEEFTYSFKGEFNGIYRNLLKNGAKSFALLELLFSTKQQYSKKCRAKPSTKKH